MNSPAPASASLPADGATRLTGGAAPAPIGFAAGAAKVSVWQEIWARRELLKQLILRDIRLRYHQAVMGFLWALLMPCLVLGASLLVRSLLQHAGGGANAAPLAGTALKAWGWAFFVGSINFATSSLLGNINLISKIYFPRELLPMAAVGAQAFDAIVGLLFFAIMSPMLQVHYSWGLLWVLPLALLLALATFGLSLFLAAANVFYRDIKYLVQVAVTFGIFITPVFYTLGDISPRMRMVVLLNPLAPILEALHLTVTRGVNLLHAIPATDGGLPLWSPWYLAGTTLFSFVVLVAAEKFFRAKSDRFAELA